MATVNGIEYKIVRVPAFDIIGFTKIVQSGGELFGETREDGRWAALTEMRTNDKTVYCVAAETREVNGSGYRYTVGVLSDGGFVVNPMYREQLYMHRIKASDWIVFSLKFGDDYGKLWHNNPYKMIAELGYTYNKSLNIHIDVFGETFETDGMMEFWMPVK